MKQFTTGVLFGIGLGLLFTPLPGQDMRRLLRQRVQQLRGTLPASVSPRQDVSSLTSRRTQTSGAVTRDFDQPTEPMKKVASHPTPSGTATQQSAGETSARAATSVSSQRYLSKYSS